MWREGEKKDMVIYTQRYFGAPTNLFLFLALALSAAMGTRVGHSEDEPETYVYEGKSASSWAAELKTRTDHEKAFHALNRLGSQSIPALLILLKDENFEVRRNAVRALGPLAWMDANAIIALKVALKDRDKAVAESAEEALLVLDKQPKPSKIEDAELPEKPREDSKRARANANAKDLAVQKETEDDRVEYQTRQEFKVLIKEARIVSEKGDFNAAMRIVTAAGKLFPDDPSAAELRKRIVEKQAAIQAKNNGGGDVKKSVGERNPFD